MSKVQTMDEKDKTIFKTTKNPKKLFSLEDKTTAKSKLANAPKCSKSHWTIDSFPVNQISSFNFETRVTS